MARGHAPIRTAANVLRKRGGRLAPHGTHCEISPTHDRWLPQAIRRTTTRAAFARPAEPNGSPGSRVYREASARGPPEIRFPRSGPRPGPGRAQGAGFPVAARLQVKSLRRYGLLGGAACTGVALVDRAAGRRAVQVWIRLDLGLQDADGQMCVEHGFRADSPRPGSASAAALALSPACSSSMTESRAEPSLSACTVGLVRLGVELPDDRDEHDGSSARRLRMHAVPRPSSP